MLRDYQQNILTKHKTSTAFESKDNTMTEKTISSILLLLCLGSPVAALELTSFPGCGQVAHHLPFSQGDELSSPYQALPSPGKNAFLLGERELSIIRGAFIPATSARRPGPPAPEAIILWDEASANNPPLNVSRGHNNLAVNILTLSSH